MINLDHNATTPMHPQVRTAIVELLGRADLGNPSSTHALGRATRDVVEAARRSVAGAVDAQPLGVTFVSGGTEADNLAVLGGVRSLRKRGLAHGLLTSRLEHPGVEAAARALEGEGVPVVWLPISPHGTFTPEQVAQTLDAHPEVGLVSLATANHELGNVQPIADIVGAVRAVRADVLVHSDAVQALGKVPVAFEAWDLDLLSVSSHKIGGPPGVGALVHRTHTKLVAGSFGGSQERGRRVGTEGWPLIHGFGVAAGLVDGEAFAQKLCPLRDRVIESVRAHSGRIHGNPALPNTINFAFEGAPGELMVMNFDLEGIALSTGAACSAGSLEPSKVIGALGLPPERAAEAVRVSLGQGNTADEVERFVGLLPKVVQRVRAASGRAAS